MSVSATTKFQFSWQDHICLRRFRSGVSLHSHTMYSEETLAMIPAYTRYFPGLDRALRPKKLTLPNGDSFDLDLNNCYWTPPYSPRQCYRLEEKQIQRRLGLPALVSLTDHDDIRAASQLHVLERFRKAPVSLEWTVPFGNTFFHLGLHNLPAANSSGIAEQLACYTRKPSATKLREILQNLNSHPELLVVVNHPLWDESGIGEAAHRAALNDLLTTHGQLLHALELNGLRCWRENQQVITLARAANLPAISGGDRHGREPNAVVNLTAAETFDDFVHEVRDERKSHVVFLPQYRENTNVRLLQMVVDVFSNLPENSAGRRLWSDRIFCRDLQTDVLASLTAAWHEGVPLAVSLLVRSAQLLQTQTVRTALKLALIDRYQYRCQTSQIPISPEAAT